MPTQEKLPEQPDDDGNKDTYNPLSEKDRDKEKFFLKMYDSIESGFMFSCNKSGTVHATTLVDDVIETMQLNSERMSSKIKKLIRTKFNFRPAKALIAELMEELQDQTDDTALEVHEVHHRVALGAKGQIFVDLHGDGNVVLEVDKNGYRHHDFATEAPSSSAHPE